MVSSAVLYVNLAGYHVKALRGGLAGRGSGMFVTSLYGTAAISGYLIGAPASRVGWQRARDSNVAALSYWCDSFVGLAYQRNDLVGLFFR